MATYSPLTDEVMSTRKAESRRGASVSRVIVHHWAGTAGGIERLVHSSDKASANYIIADGQIIGSVPEELRAWTSGSLQADAPSLTIEVQNSKRGGQWPVSDDNWRALVRLVADIADRHGWGDLTLNHVRGHREFAATACPGPYLWDRRGQLVGEAQAARGGKPAPKPKPASKPAGKSVSVMADEVIRGEHGNGHANRRKSLGVSAATYAKVRAEVNRRLL